MLTLMLIGIGLAALLCIAGIAAILLVELGDRWQ